MNTTGRESRWGTLRRRAGWVAWMPLALAPVGLSGQEVAAASDMRTAVRGPVVPLEVRFLDYGATQEVPGEALYRDARDALNQREYERAAELFAQLRRRYPDSPFTADSYYYQAFAQYRRGQETSGRQAERAHRRALELLVAQETAHGNAGTMSDARALRARVQAELARMGDEASRQELNRRAQVACDEEDQELRATALSALLNMDEERARPILKEVLASRDECSGELRAQAVFILSQHADDETVELLLDLAYRNPDPDPEVREQAVFWLGQVDRPEAIAALLDILESTDDEAVIEQAIFALSQHDDPRAQEVLMEYARRPGASSELRGQAIFWISQHGGAESIEFLRAIWQEVDEPELKEAVVFAMAEAGGDESMDFLLDVALDPRQTTEVRQNALFWAGQRGVDVATLMDVLRSSDDPEIHEAVVFALSQNGEPEAIEALMEIARSSNDPEMREQAIFWLGQSDDPRVAAFLLEIIRR